MLAYSQKDRALTQQVNRHRLVLIDQFGIQKYGVRTYSMMDANITAIFR